MSADDVLEVLVAEIRPEADGVISIVLSADGALSPFEPGAHIDLFVPDGPARQYSLVQDARERSFYRLAVLRDPASRGGSQWIHDRLQANDRLTISHPRNHFRLVDAPFSSVGRRQHRHHAPADYGVLGPVSRSGDDALRRRRARERR